MTASTTSRGREGNNLTRENNYLGKWNDAPGPIIATHTGGCPSAPGDGLCVAHDLAAAQSGGARLGNSAMLAVGYFPADVLGRDGDSKVRVRRMWVVGAAMRGTDRPQPERQNEEATS